MKIKTIALVVVAALCLCAQVPQNVFSVWNSFDGGKTTTSKGLEWIAIDPPLTKFRDANGVLHLGIDMSKMSRVMCDIQRLDFSGCVRIFVPVSTGVSIR